MKPLAIPCFDLLPMQGPLENKKYGPMAMMFNYWCPLECIIINKFCFTQTQLFHVCVPGVDKVSIFHRLSFHMDFLEYS